MTDDTPAHQAAVPLEPIHALADFVNENISNWMIPRVFVRPNIPASLVENASIAIGEPIAFSSVLLFIDDCPDRTGSKFLAIRTDRISAVSHDGIARNYPSEAIRRISSSMRKPTADNASIATISINETVFYGSTHINSDVLAKIVKRADACLDKFGIPLERTFLDRLSKGGEKVLDFIGSGADLLAPAGIAAIEESIKLIEKRMDRGGLTQEDRKKAQDSLRYGYNKLISSAKSKADQARRTIAFDDDRKKYEPHGYQFLDDLQMRDLKDVIADVSRITSLRDEKAKKYQF